jgi:predicted O-methyltransferase YrrM
MDKQTWNPGTLLELSGYYWKTCTLHAGVKMDVFTAVGEAVSSAAEVAQKTGSDPRAMERLLDALVAMGLLVKQDGTYGNTTASAEFLSKDGDKYIGYMIMHHHHLVESWARLDQAVKTGQPQRSRTSFSDEQRRESFLMGMFNLAMNLAPKIVPLIDLSGRRRLLDLGGGPGTYAIFFCKGNPDLKATVFDLPTTRPFAEKTIARMGVADRVAFADGNFIADDISGKYDVIWMSHILHGEGPEDCRMIIRKAVSALQPGGMIIVHEFILDDTMDAPLFPALFSLNMLLGTDAGQAYSEKQLAEMFTDAGVKDIQRLRFDSPNDSSLLIGSV